MNTIVNDFHATMFSMENFGSWLIEHLQDKNISQSELARLAGVSKGTISNLINGTKGAGEASLRKIARALQLPPALVFQKAGLLPPSTDDAWVAEQAHRLEQISDPALRQLAERFILSILEQEDATKKLPPHKKYDRKEQERKESLAKALNA